MSEKVLVDVNHLKNIRKNIDVLIDNKFATPSSISEALPSTIEKGNLSEKERNVLDYIRKNPGTTKKGVEDGIGKYSRVPVFRTISCLVRYGIVVVRKDENNSQIHHLYVNNENLLLSVIQDFDEFKRGFFPLLEKVKEKMRELESKRKSIHKRDDKYEDKILKSEDDLLYGIVSIHRHVVDMYVIFASTIWPSKTHDRETLNKAYLLFLDQIQESQSKVSEVIVIIDRPSNHDLRVRVRYLFDLISELGISYFREIYETFRRFKLLNEFKPVMDFLWNISFDYIPFQEQNPELLRGQKARDKLRDWRNVLLKKG
jgi:hypothetical protein